MKLFKLLEIDTLDKKRGELVCMKAYYVAHAY